MISEESFHSCNDGAGVECTMKKNFDETKVIAWKVPSDKVGAWFVSHLPRIWQWYALVPRKLVFTLWGCGNRLTTFWHCFVPGGTWKAWLNEEWRMSNIGILCFLSQISFWKTLLHPIWLESGKSATYWEAWDVTAPSLPRVLWRPWRQFNPNSRCASITTKVFVADGSPADCQL